MKTIKNKGITLIALVVTIIVLLILAGVSISMLTGENGILKRANEAKEETARTTEDEQRKLAMYEASMNTERTYFQDVPIPAGFAPTRIAGESTVDEGLVITDSQGNEFVWIPCKYSKEDANGNENAVIYNVDNAEKGHDNRDVGWISKQYCYNGGTWYDSQPHTVGKTSIEKYYGFYVARYEAGVPENANFYVSEEMSEEKLKYTMQEVKNNIDTTGNKQDIRELSPVSKKGNQVWNYISQKNAKIVAGNMVKNSNVKSYLIDSHAWNTICRIIQKKYKDTDSTKVTDSTKWGNYCDNTNTKYEKLKGLWAKHIYNSDWELGNYQTTTIPKKNNGDYIELASGLSEDFKAYNIYDLAGNMWEWTTESGQWKGNDTPNESTNCEEGEPETSNLSAVLRGGTFGHKGSELPVVDARGDHGNGQCYVHVGFRVVLYLE